MAEEKAEETATEAAPAASKSTKEKAKIKAQIKGLKEKRAAAVEAKDRARLKHARLNIKRLKQKLRQVGA